MKTGSHHEKIGQSYQHVIRVESPRNRDRQALAAELVNYREHFERSPSDCAVSHEIVSPQGYSAVEVAGYMHA